MFHLIQYINFIKYILFVKQKKIGLTEAYNILIFINKVCQYIIIWTQT